MTLSSIFEYIPEISLSVTFCIKETFEIYKITAHINIGCKNQVNLQKNLALYLKVKRKFRELVIVQFFFKCKNLVILTLKCLSQ